MDGFVWQNGTLTDLGAIIPVAINDAGQVAGDGARHALFWQNGTITDLGELVPGGSSTALAINGSGQVTGSAETSTGPHAFFWSGGGLIDIGTFPGTLGSYPVAINDAGQVTGYSYYYDSANNLIFRAFSWTETAGMKDLGYLGGMVGSTSPTALNNSGQIVGWSYLFGNVGAAHPFLWQNGTLADLGTLDGSFALATDINSSGQVSGWGPLPPVPPESFHTSRAITWQEGQQIELGTLGGSNARANAITDSGVIVGHSDTADATHAALWVRDTAPVADASATKTLLISPNNVSAAVTLDATRSTDPDGDPLTYKWYIKSNDPNTPFAEGATYPATLAVGSWQFELDVNDGWLTASTTVTITVITAAQAVANLVSQVGAADLPNGITNTLIGDLNAAASSFNRGSFKSGVNQLQQFTYDVNAQSGKKIDPATANTLIAAAQAIINTVAGA